MLSVNWRPGLRQLQFRDWKPVTEPRQFRLKMPKISEREDCLKWIRKQAYLSLLMDTSSSESDSDSNPASGSTTLDSDADLAMSTSDSEAESGFEGIDEIRASTWAEMHVILESERYYGKQLSGAALHNDPDNGLLHPRVVENGVSKGPPQKGRVKRMGAGMSGSGRGGGDASGASLVGGEPVPVHSNESSTNQAVKATQNGGKVAASRQKQDRNEICACGSQRKWKNCCGKADV